MSPIHCYADSNLKILKLFSLEAMVRADMSRLPTSSPAGKRIASSDVRVDQGTACHRRHRLDGGHALSAAAVRVSLRSRDRLEAVRDVQGHGTPPAEGDHQSGDDRDLARRALHGLDWWMVCQRLVPHEVSTGSHPVWRPRPVYPLGAGIRCRQEHTEPKVLQIYQ